MYLAKKYKNSIIFLCFVSIYDRVVMRTLRTRKVAGTTVRAAAVERATLVPRPSSLSDHARIPSPALQATNPMVSY